MPNLTTPRLRVHSFGSANLDEFLAFHTHPEVARTMGKPPMGCEAAVRYLAAQAALEDAERGHWHGYAIAVGGRIVGEVGFYLQTEPEGEADLGFALHPEFQGQGLATEAASALVQWGFERLGLRRITAHCDAENPASWRVMERLGMRREPAPEESLAYELTRHEWLTQGT